MKKLIQLYVSWFKMGLFTFGGGYAMLPMIQKEVIEKYHWATEDEVMDYYAIGQCTPGVIAVNTSTFIGYYQAGVPGATCPKWNSCSCMYVDDQCGIKIR